MTEQPDTRLAQLHTRLVQEMTAFHAQLPTAGQGVDEDCERQARVLALLVRSLDILIRADGRVRNDKDKADKRTRSELLNEIESALDRLATTRGAAEVSE